MNENMAKLEELLKNETVGKAVFGESVGETQKNLEKAGIKFTVDELTDILKGISEADEANSEELAEDELEAVAGGAYENDCYNVGKKIGQLFGWAVQLAKSLFK